MFHAIPGMILAIETDMFGMGWSHSSVQMDEAFILGPL